MAEEKKNPAADFERQRKQKVMLFSAALSCVFLVVLWLIFRPTAEPQPEGAGGINLTVPDGREQVIEGNKQKAVERIRSEEAQNKRLSTLGDNSFSLLDDGLKYAEEAPAENPAQRAEAANRAMQAQMQDFYRAPPRNAEVEALKEQVEALQSQLDAERRQPDALELAEQQYRLAQKYLGSGEDSSEPEQKRDKSRKSVMRPCGRATCGPRRSIPMQMSPQNVTWDSSPPPEPRHRQPDRQYGPASPRRRSCAWAAWCGSGYWSRCA